MHFWAPQIDPAHPMDCTHAERYAVRRLDSGRYLAIHPEDQRMLEVGSVAEAYLFHTHEAALRAAQELNRNALGPVDVVKVE